MFESIAMICYLSMVQPQEIQEPVLLHETKSLEVYTGNGGGEPEEDPSKKKRDQYQPLYKLNEIIARGMSVTVK